MAYLKTLSRQSPGESGEIYGSFESESLEQSRYLNNPICAMQEYCNPSQVTAAFRIQRLPYALLLPGVPSFA